MAPPRDGPPFFAEEPLGDVQVVEDRSSRLLVRGPLTVEVGQPHQESHSDGDQIALGGEGLLGREAERPVLRAYAGTPERTPRDAGQPEMPDAHNSSEHQRHDTSSRNCSVEQKSCAAENLVSKPPWTRKPSAIVHSDQFPSPRNTSAQSQRTPSVRAGAMPGSGDERSTSESDGSAVSSRARSAARDRCSKSSR